MHICDVDNCGAEFKSKVGLRTHRAKEHKLGTVYYCDETNCTEHFGTSDHLKRHKQRKHHDGETWFICEECGKKYKTSESLTSHKRFHGEKKFKCSVKGCDKSFHTNPKLNRHMLSHTDEKTVVCEECSNTFKSNDALIGHINSIHKNIKRFFCKYCDYASYWKAHVEDHIQRNHTKQEEKICCEYKNCTYYTFVQNNLDRHVRYTHREGATMHYCTEENEFGVKCNYESPLIQNFKRHLELVHDMGDEECDYCYINCYRLSTHKQGGITSHICRKCFQKATGRNSRVEIVMSNYLDTHFGTEFLLASDQRIRGEACQTYRPDKLYAGPKLVVHTECDENQHNGSHYSCDEKRISDIYDEFPGKKYVVIRWNPDRYTVPEGKVKVSAQNEKLEMLLDCMERVRKNPPKDMITIIYMFYSEDNEAITQNFPKIMIWDKEDLLKV